MKFFKRAGILAAVLGCGVLLCLGLTALSDGVFQNRLTVWPGALAQENESGSNEDADSLEAFVSGSDLAEPESDSAVSPGPAAEAEISSDSEANAITVFITGMPWNTPKNTPAPYGVYSFAAAVAAQPQPTSEAAALLSGFAEKARPAATEKAGILLEDTISIPNADDPDALRSPRENAAVQAFFAALRAAYAQFTGFQVPDEGYACNAYYVDEMGDMIVSWEPADMALRQMNGETEMLAYRMQIASRGASGNLQTPELSFGLRGFRLGSGQVGEKLRDDVEKLAGEADFAAPWVITEVYAQDSGGGLLEYVVEDAFDSDHSIRLVYTVPGFSRRDAADAKQDVLDALARVMYSCRAFTPVRRAVDGKAAYFVNTGLLARKLIPYMDHWGEFTGDQEALARIGDGVPQAGPGFTQGMEVNLPFASLPDFLKQALEEMGGENGIPAEALSGMNLDDLTIATDGAVSAWLNGRALPLGYTEMNEGLILDLERDAK